MNHFVMGIAYGAILGVMAKFLPFSLAGCVFMLIGFLVGFLGIICR